MSERERFEKWWATVRPEWDDWNEHNAAWAAWQAALAAAPADALENCRLYAARHRKEEWAQTILRFCEEGGATGSPLRAAAPAAPAPEPVAWTSWMNGPCEITKDKNRADSWAANGGDVRPLYATKETP